MVIKHIEVDLSVMSSLTCSMANIPAATLVMQRNIDKSVTVVIGFVWILSMLLLNCLLPISDGALSSLM